MVSNAVKPPRILVNQNVPDARHKRKALPIIELES